MNSDTSEDLRIGPEILKQQAELYRRLRNSLRWILGSLDSFSDTEKLPESEFPELEQLILHRLWELNAKIQTAITSHDWTGVYPAIHHFCSTDLSAFYFDIRKDSLYCDRADSQKRRACRTVLDILHRCLTAWLAPALPFTAEESWVTRFGEDQSVHLTLFPEVPENWKNEALANKWAEIKKIRSIVFAYIEAGRAEKRIGSSLQAAVSSELRNEAKDLLTDEVWAETCIVSKFTVQKTPNLLQMTPPPGSSGSYVFPYPISLAPGQKCERCWRVLEEVGANTAHPTLCVRCCEAVSP